MSSYVGCDLNGVLVEDTEAACKVPEVTCLYACHPYLSKHTEDSVNGETRSVAGHNGDAS